MRTLDPRNRSKLPSLPVLTLPDDGRSADAMERRRLYSSPRWRALRAAVLARFPFCALCGKRASIADHVAGHGAGPGWRTRFFDRDCVQSLCVGCHATKTSGEVRANADAERDRIRCEIEALRMRAPSRCLST